MPLYWQTCQCTTSSKNL